jgi:hypothetical protein
MGWVWVCGNFFSTSDLHNLRRVEPQRFWGSMGFESEATERMEIPCKIPRGERCSPGVAFSPVETFSRDQQITSGIYLTRNPTSCQGTLFIDVDRGVLPKLLCKLCILTGQVWRDAKNTITKALRLANSVNYGIEVLSRWEFLRMPQSPQCA